MKKLIIPVIALGAVLSVAAISFVYAEGNHKGGHGHDAASGRGGAHWASPEAAAARINPVKSDQASLDRGKQVFMKNCTSCHGAKAKGDGPVGANLNPKPTDLTIMAGNHPDGDFEWKIANGRGPMPGWKTVLNENQRWDLVNYIQALENPNGKGNMVGMDHSNMSEADMATMDHSKMGHLNEDDHTQVEKADGHAHDKKHTH